MDNILIKGDNIDGLNWLLDNGYEGKIDLVYIDPPFATGRKFWLTDTNASSIMRGENAVLAYTDTTKGDDFIEFLRERIVLIHRLLSDRGSFYLHTDCKYSHYIKVMLDTVFGRENFKNDITRIKCNPKNFSKVGYGNIKDVILFYTKTNKPIWNNPMVPQKEGSEKRYRLTDENGRKYTTVPIHAPGESKSGDTSMPFRGMYPPPGRHWRCSVDKLEELDKAGLLEWSSKGNPRRRIYMDEHPNMKMQDIWEFKDPSRPIYPTEKNYEMLKTIILASSNPGSIVLDCFCGSGSTLLAADDNGRNWIGMDQSEESIKVVSKRFGIDNTYHFEDLSNKEETPSD